MANMRHFPGKAPKPGAVASPDAGSEAATTVSARDRLWIQGWILTVAALAWAYLFYLDHRMAADMAQGAMPAPMDMPAMPMDRPWTAADVFFTFLMWVVMMTGMMAGSTIPVMLLFAGAQARRGRARARWMVSLFGLGYGIVWVGFSALATLAQWALHNAAMLSPAMAVPSSIIGAAILCLAGIYQLTPLKQACLKRCRSPLGFILTNWRDGAPGALQMGIRHGAYCLGCCWALMTILFVVGVMNLLWVAALSLFVILEKLGPAGSTAARLAGMAMIAAGIGMFVRGW